MKMEKIQLDISADMTLSELDEWCKQHDVKAQIVTLFGPGGGNPIIEFEGTKFGLIGLMEEYGMDYDEMKEYYDWV